MSLGLVVSTLGRAEPLERLLRSLAPQLRADDRVVIVAQDRVEEVEALADRYRGAGTVIDVTTSERGASRGRNAGVAALPPGDRLLHFPNDTTWFPDGSVDAIRRAADGIAVGALTVADEHGPKFRLPPAGTPLDRWNAWSVIEMGLLIRRSVFDEVGGFDPDLGTGAPSPWQAGEATDLLLRLAALRPDLAAGFHWLPPDVAVGGVSDPQGLSTAERRRKLRAYGRGMGRVVARHPYPWWWRFAFVSGGLAFGLRHRSTNTPGDGWPVFLGRSEGILGRAFGGPTTAVTR
ncbi:glycosyltransferase involved in cell wall biosynthesis [Agromyces sp. 3263]|uniref:glycosyltransferase family 2 protein n=1 Tax=Agromyces sp. 3263 TaxID=2817750 RepID=UPI0028626C26|nr:glycosyltransferase involved in cell wall biosynthesis [Agromyces sp. 3263]